MIRTVSDERFSHVIEGNDNRAALALGACGRWSACGNLFGIDDMTSGACKSTTHFLFVCGMNVVRIADIDRDSETGWRIFAGCESLRFTHPCPAALNGLGRN